MQHTHLNTLNSVRDTLEPQVGQWRQLGKSKATRRPSQRAPEPPSRGRAGGHDETVHVKARATELKRPDLKPCERQKPHQAVLRVRQKTAQDLEG